MINKQFKYKAKFVSHPQDKYTAFQTGFKGKNSSEWQNYRMFVLSKVDITDDDDFMVTDIISCESKTYNGKQQFSVTVEIKVIGGEKPTNDVGLEPVLNITGDDLPF